MIEEGRITIGHLFTGRTRQSSPCALCRLRNIFCAMLSHEMDYPICLCKSLIRATRTFERSGLLLGMFCRHVYSKSLGLKKLFFTNRTLEREMTLVILHVIVHRVLVLLHCLADRTHKVPLIILLIRISHDCLPSWSTHHRFNFLPAACRLSPSFITMAIMPPRAIRFARKIRLGCATVPVILFCRHCLLSRLRINIQ